MDESISTFTSSVSKLSADILAVQIDMNIMSDKLEKKFNEIIALLATTQTPTRKVARGTNSSPVKHAASMKGHVDAFGGVVTQRKTQTPPASQARKVNAETWANMCDEEVQEEYMHSSVNILMEVDSTEADGNQLESSIMGVDAAARTHIPATQDSSKAVANSRRCNLQSDPKSDFGQVQTHKVTLEALALFPFQQETVTNEREKYPLQNQTTAVAPEALAIFSDRSVPLWTYAGQRRVKEHNKEVTPEAMSNYRSITIHLSPSSKDTIPSLSSVAADIIK
jgi:hypothetical protein